MTFDEQLRRAFETLSDSLRDTAAELSALAAADREAVAADREAVAADAADRARRDAADQTRAALHEEANAAALEANRRLVDAIRAIDRATSLSEILDTLVDAAGSEASRAGILLIHGDRLRGQRFVGFEPPFDGNEIDVAVHDSGVIADAIRTGSAVTSRGAERQTPVPFANVPDGIEATAVPIAMAGQVVAVVYADQGARDLHVGWPQRVEVLARHAARCLEALTAAKTARMFSNALEAPSTKPATITTSNEAAGDVPEEEDEAARRYARLLVSEIKMYHEAAVAEGRRARDILTRLGGEIARARVLYEQRVAAHRRRGTDYFHEELVRTLADGDSSLLGELKAGTA